MNMIDTLKSINAITPSGKINPKVQRILDNHQPILDQVVNETSFLDESASLRERVWCIQHGVDCRPVCDGCGSSVIFNKQKRQYNSYCSKSCSWSDKANVEKAKATKLERYGSETFNNIDKAKQTNLERYGSTSPAGNSEVMDRMLNSWTDEKRTIANEKRASTNTDTYGTTSYAASNIPSSIRDKLNDKSLMTKLVAECAMTINQISKHLGVSMYSVRSSLINHGITNADRVQFIGNLKSQFKDVAPSTVLNDPVQLDIVRQYNLSPVELATVIGCTPSYIYNHNQKPVFNNSRSVSSTESEVVEFIRSLLPDGDIVCNDRVTIPPYELDVVIPSRGVAIEINGVYWHSELSGGKGRRYHKDKHTMCSDIGIQLIQIYSSEWVSNPELVKSRLRCKLTNTATKLHARKCEVRAVNTTDEREFLTTNHIQGYVPSYWCYGLYSNNKLVSLMSFGKTRYTNDGVELLRLASALDVVVVGGASKLFKAFIKLHSPLRVTSYCMLRWNTGTVYKQLGFTHDGDTNPNYSYFHTNNTNHLLSRVRFQKHKLEGLLDEYDPLLTEWNNMVNNGYDRIWDCGNGKWVWEAG